MIVRGRNTLAAGLLGSAALLLTGASAAVAAPAQPDVSISASQLTLAPTERGYRGEVPITVANRGAQVANLNLEIVEPVAGSFVGATPEATCITLQLDVRNRRTMSCSLPGGELQAGEQRTFQFSFRVLTTPQARPMFADAGQLSLSSAVADSGVLARDSFATIFKPTDGRHRLPVRYRQDVQADAAVTTGPGVALTRQPDGSFAGRLPVTVTFRGDAPHNELLLTATLPAGVRLDGTEPEEMCMGDWCSVPGGTFMEGEARTFDLMLTAPAGTAPGALGNVSLTLTTQWGPGPLADRTPADNTAAFPVTAG